MTCMTVTKLEPILLLIGSTLVELTDMVAKGSGSEVMDSGAKTGVARDGMTVISLLLLSRLVMLTALLIEPGDEIFVVLFKQLMMKNMYLL